MNSLFSDNRVTMLFGAVVAVTAAVYVAFGPSAEVPHVVHGCKKRAKKKVQNGPRGLHNSGNTCFVNAVLQAASACPSLSDWLDEISTVNVSKKQDLILSFLTVLRVINGQDTEEDAQGEVGVPDVWAKARLFRSLRTHGWVINTGEQDAHEFFQALFSTLEEELEGSKPSQSLLDTEVVKEDPQEERGRSRDSSGQRRRPRSRSSSGVVVRSGTEMSLYNVKKMLSSSSSVTPFTGTLTNKITIKQTGKSKSPTTSTAFNNITLSLPTMPDPSVPVTLETLLQMFVSMESVESGELVKQLTFARLPECLCFHVQRTAFSNGASFKRNDVVLFPSILNMDQYAYNRQISKQKAIHSASNATPIEDLLSPDDSASLPSLAFDPDCYTNNYGLRAVVVHLGGIDSGHYVTYRRESPIENHLQWYYTSDALIQEVLLEDVLKSNPYMLFYEKIHSVADESE